MGLVRVREAPAGLTARADYGLCCGSDDSADDGVRSGTNGDVGAAAHVGQRAPQSPRVGELGIYVRQPTVEHRPSKPLETRGWNNAHLTSDEEALFHLCNAV